MFKSELRNRVSHDSIGLVTGPAWNIVCDPQWYGVPIGSSLVPMFGQINREIRADLGLSDAD